MRERGVRSRCLSFILVLTSFENLGQVSSGFELQLLLEDEDRQDRVGESCFRVCTWSICQGGLPGSVSRSDCT